MIQENYVSLTEKGHHQDCHQNPSGWKHLLLLKLLQGSTGSLDLASFLNGPKEWRMGVEHKFALISEIKCLEWGREAQICETFDRLLLGAKNQISKFFAKLGP